MNAIPLAAGLRGRRHTTRALLVALTLGGLLAATFAVAPPAAGAIKADGYLTITFDQSMYALATGCAIEDGAVPLDEIASEMQARGYTAQGSVPIGYTNDTARRCRNTIVQTSWDDLATIRDDFGWTFVPDSAGPGRTNDIRTLNDADALAQTCGALPLLAARGHDRGWGMMAYPSGKTTTHIQTDIVNDCFAFGRRTGIRPTARPTLGRLGRSNPASFAAVCAGDGAACSTLDVNFRPATTEYTSRSDLLAAASTPSNRWRLLTMFRLVEGANLPGSSGATHWDCTSTNPDEHWTSRSSVYCANDFYWMLDNLPDHVRTVDAAEMAERWDRGNPNPPELPADRATSRSVWPL